ncbi:hypothetical protein HYC85_017671 [Camellia sinensis]|uniref:Calcium permeable stress-gated cation channel 1 n=1 Tax=Camellia sinensis TaxID=4442 RepID=A0A7J7GVW4_CAMSI|nr:hypothetical protein HYC85_017671 [Camellia sinensis]
MATLGDIGLAAAINIFSAFLFFLAFAALRLQPLNDRVYFPKWYLMRLRSSPTHSRAFIKKFVNLDFKSYLKFLNWMPEALRMPELELIDHAGLDSAVYLRIYLLGLKIFVPITLLAWAILVPVNWTNSTLELAKVTYSNIDKLSISNIPIGSNRFWAHIVMAYVFTFWSCYVLRKEYQTVASMRMQFLASERRRPDQFTVLVTNVPPDPDESVVYNANKLAELVMEKKNKQNWLDYYQLKYYRNKSTRPVMKLTLLKKGGSPVPEAPTTAGTGKITAERERITKDSSSVMPAAFVSFTTRWGAAVCAQTQQSKDPTKWLTEWAPEPRDIYWQNLAIPYVSLTIRRLIIAVAFFFLTFFFMIPIAFVQSLANIAAIVKILISEAKWRIPKTIGVAIPMKATFFITYIMVDGWAGIAGEILRLKPLIFYHLKNFFLVKTEKDREEAMDPGSLGFNTGEPQIQLYFLLGLVYAAVTPLLLPFILIFFSLAYVVFRHQIINVYNQQYESAAAFWPDVHGRVIAALVISQLLLMGLLSTKEAAQSTPFLIALPVLTIWFYRFCKGRYEPAFIRYPLQEAMMKDTLERATEPNLNLKDYLRNAYIHPVFKGEDDEDDEDEEVSEKWEQESVLVPTKRQSRKNTPQPSKVSSNSSPSLPDVVQHPQP